MARHGRPERDLRGFRIAHLADQDHVRILAQDGTQHPGKAEVDLVVRLHLVDAGKPVFHRVFDRDDLGARVVELPQRGIKGGGLAAAGGAGDQHQAVGTVQDGAKAFLHVGRHAEAVDGKQVVALAQQPHHHGFAVLRRHGGQPHVDGAAAYLDRKAAVLRQAFFRNIQPGNDLEAQGQRRRNLEIGLGLRMQHPVDAEADGQLFFLRFDVQVGRIHLQRILEQRLQQAHHRRIGLPFAQRLQADDTGLALAHVAREFLGQAVDIVGAPVDPVDGRQQVAFRHHGKLDVLRDQPGDFIVSGQIGRVGHADENTAVPPRQRHGPETSRLRFRQQLQDGGIRIEFPEIDEGKIQLPRQRLGNVVFARQPAFDDDAAQAAPAFLLRRQCDVQVGAGNDLLLDEQVAQADFLASGLGGSGLGG